MERRLLESALDACADDGHGHGFVVRGEAGIGKTRLVEEMARSAAARGFGVHVVRFLDVGGAREPLRDLVFGLFAPSPGGEGRAAVERAVRECGLGPVDRALAGDLLGDPSSPAHRGVLDAMDDAARPRGRAAVVQRLVFRATGERPRLLIFDDVHWADAATLADLRLLVETVADCRAVLVMTTRVEEEPAAAPWRVAGPHPPSTLIELTPFRPHEAASLAAGFRGVGDAVVAACIERAGGNPLFLEQLLRGAADGEQRVPVRVRSVVQERIDGLPPADRRALEAASVVGRRFSPALVRHLVGDPDYTFDVLVTRALVTPDAGHYRFVQGLVAEAVYETLLEARRRHLHRQAAAWLAPRDPGLEAEHLARAGDPARGAAWLRGPLRSTPVVRGVAPGAR